VAVVPLQALSQRQRRFHGYHLAAGGQQAPGELARPGPDFEPPRARRGFEPGCRAPDEFKRLRDAASIVMVCQLSEFKRRCPAGIRPHTCPVFSGIAAADATLACITIAPHLIR
jgi:hypothetical protein